MSNVVDFQAKALENSPHLEGEAVCVHCKHVWAAVAPVHINNGLECPECKLRRGVWRYNVEVNENEIRYKCNHCTSEYFMVTLTSVFCIGCGNRTTFEQLAERAP